MRKSSYYRGSDDGYDYSRDNRNGEVDIFLKSLESYYAEKKRKEEEEKKESKWDENGNASSNRCKE